MTRVIAISTNKGGVLKTSLTTNLAGVLAENHRVLIIDTDNQGDTALSFGRNPDDYENTVYDVLVDGLSPEEAIDQVQPNIDILPSNDDMSFFEFDVLTDIKTYPEPFLLLNRAINGSFLETYDYVLVDTPPNLGLTTGNVLSFVDEVLIPFQPENYSMRSLVKVIQSIKGFKEKHNPNLSVLGVVATLVNQRTVLHSQVLQECRRYCHENDLNIFETVIPQSVRFASSVAYEGLPATLTNKSHPLVQSYLELAKEVASNGA